MISLANTVIKLDLSWATILRSTNIGCCDWRTRLAPLESDAAVVGGECETVSSLKYSCAEAETESFDNIFKGDSNI